MTINYEKLLEIVGLALALSDEDDSLSVEAITGYICRFLEEHANE